MTNEPQTTTRRRVRPKPRMTCVAAVERPTPDCVRITLTGPELEGFTTKGPAEHIKVFLPRNGEDAPQIPEWGPEGPILQDGQQMPPSRTYTPRFWRPESSELVVDFMLHGDGLASHWAQNARAGDLVAVSGQPGGAYTLAPEADWYVIAGDESALPAIGTLLEALPSGVQAQVLVEVPGPAEEQPLTSEAKLDITWLHRRGPAAIAGQELKGAMQRLTLPPGDGRIWLGCEASIMRSIRRHLLEERGLDRESIHTQGYWKQGAANHPDNDRGQDE